MAAFIPAGLSILGGILGHVGKKREANAQHEQGRGEYERGAASRAARAQFIQGIMKGYGIENMVDPGTMSKLTTPTAYPKAAGPSAFSGIGGFMQGIAPYLGARPGANSSELEGSDAPQHGTGNTEDDDPWGIFKALAGGVGR